MAISERRNFFRSFTVSCLIPEVLSLIVITLNTAGNWTEFQSIFCVCSLSF